MCRGRGAHSYLIYQLADETSFRTKGLDTKLLSADEK